MSSRSSETITANQEKPHTRDGVNAWEKDLERRHSVPPDFASEPNADTEGTTTPASQGTVASADGYEVTLGPEDDPKNISTGRKWLITLAICNAALCATFASSVVCRPFYPIRGS